MITLRELEEKDAPLMLEWMHDPEIQKGFQKNMMGLTLKDAEMFCKSSIIPKKLSDGQSLHWAIVNEKDEYLGTISLKKISLKNKTAEYAISTRHKIHGKGVAIVATKLLFYKAFEEYGLHRVYLNVLEDNQAAIRFYIKCGFVYEGEFREHLIMGGKHMTLKWYGILEEEYRDNLHNEKQETVIYKI